MITAAKIGVAASAAALVAIGVSLAPPAHATPADDLFFKRDVVGFATCLRSHTPYGDNPANYTLLYRMVKRDLDSGVSIAAETQKMTALTALLGISPDVAAIGVQCVAAN
jgi:hypothetical protein